MMITYLLHWINSDGERGVVPGHLGVGARAQRVQRVQRGGGARARAAGGAGAQHGDARHHHQHAARHHADQEGYVVCKKVSVVKKSLAILKWAK